MERTFAWLMRHRRLVRDYETTESSAEAWAYIARNPTPPPRVIPRNPCFFRQALRELHDGSRICIWIRKQQCCRRLSRSCLFWVTERLRVWVPARGCCFWYPSRHEDAASKRALPHKIMTNSRRHAPISIHYSESNWNRGAPARRERQVCEWRLGSDFFDHTPVDIELFLQDKAQRLWSELYFPVSGLVQRSV